MRTLVSLILVALVAAAVAVPAASGRSHKLSRQARAVIRDCVDNGRLDKRYSLKALREARKHLPSDVRAYTKCPDVITRAINAELAIRDCHRDGDLDKRYSRGALREALRHLHRGDRCRGVMKRALKKH